MKKANPYLSMTRDQLEIEIDSLAEQIHEADYEGAKSTVRMLRKDLTLVEQALNQVRR